MQPHRYLLALAGSAVLAAVAAVLFTVWVDPYRFFDTSPVAGWTALKPRIYEQASLAKIYALERVAPKTLLLGNSRVEVGFDPEDPAWPKDAAPVFNAALAGRDLFSALVMLRDAIAVGPPKTVILGLDFLDFLGPQSAPDAPPPPPGADERRSLVDRKGGPNPQQPLQLWRDRVAATLTLDALLDSAATIVDQNPKTTATMTPRGFNPLHEYRIFVARGGYHDLFVQKNAVYRAQYQQQLPPDLTQPARIADYRDLMQIIALAREHGIAVVLFVHPYHADYLEMLHAVGLWPSFEAWKAALAGWVEAAGRVRPPIRLIDFSGYNAITEEAVPPAGNTSRDMRWYWEPGHYKSALGDRMLQAINGEPGFGRALAPATSAAVLAEDEADRARYVAAVATTAR